MADAVKKILLVEDNSDHSFVAKYSIVTATSYEVDIVSTGQEALTRIRTTPYDLALIDYHLPDANINGLDILKEIMANCIDLPVIMITGLGSEMVAVEAMKMGAYDYIIKTGDYFKLLPSVIKEALEKHRLLKMIEEKVTKDMMTGVYNRNHFHELYQRELARAKRYQHMLTVAMVDVDNLKSINDTYGHGVGDQVLMHLGSVLRNSLRATDIVARYGGDEFVIVMLETGPNEAHAVLQRVRHELDQFNAQKLLPVSVSISIGISYGDHNYDNLLKEADKNMYQDKRRHAHHSPGTGWTG